MEHTHHISENLKRLRLPGMLYSLELRVKEAGDNNLGYAEFLSLLSGGNTSDTLIIFHPLSRKAQTVLGDIFMSARIAC